MFVPTSVPSSHPLSLTVSVDYLLYYYTAVNFVCWMLFNPVTVFHPQSEQWLKYAAHCVSYLKRKKTAETAAHVCASRALSSELCKRLSGEQ